MISPADLDHLELTEAGEAMAWDLLDFMKELGALGVDGSLPVTQTSYIVRWFTTRDRLADVARVRQPQ